VVDLPYNGGTVEGFPWHRTDISYRQPMQVVKGQFRSGKALD
jgi:hypothetical protein